MTEAYLYARGTPTSNGAVPNEQACIVALLVLVDHWIPGRYFAGPVHRRSGGEDDGDKSKEGRLEKLHDVGGRNAACAAAQGKERAE